ncbi:MAG: hydrogenase maturation nickel metallochaperone HypA [Bdellovibrionota bacterium]
MHELSIAQNIVEIATQELHQWKGAKVCSISIELGEFSGVVKECLEFAFPEACKGSVLEGCALEVYCVDTVLRCLKCFNVDKAIDSSLLCRKCGSVQVEMIHGKELKITNMEIE